MKTFNSALPNFFTFNNQFSQFKPIIKVRTGTLTGKCRYRIGWFGKVILQFEYYHLDAYNGTYREDADKADKRWRDATGIELRNFHERL